MQTALPDRASSRRRRPCLVALAATALLFLGVAAGAREFGESPHVQEFSPEEVMQILIWGDENSPVVIDSRPRNKYAEGHVPGALNVDAKETWGRLEELRQYEHRGIIYYDKKGLASRGPSHGLLREGFRKVGIMKGHLVEWQRRGYPVAVGSGSE